MNDKIQAFNCVGNLALKSEYEEKFIVLDGGLAKKSRCQYSVDTNVSTNSTQQMRISVQAMVLVLIACVLLFNATFLIKTYVAANASTKFSNIATEQIVIHTGDNLWDIAKDHSVEGSSISETIDYIYQINNLQSGKLMPGQKLMVPKS